MIYIFFSKKEPEIIKKICKEIEYELYLTNFPDDFDQEDVNHEKARLIKEHTKHFVVAIEIYKDFAENYSNFFKPFRNIDKNSHPKTIMEIVAYNIIHEAINEKPYEKEG